MGELVNEIMAFSFPYSSLPFDEFIRYLNGGHYLDTFEVGSVKIPETIWPTVSRTTRKRNVAAEEILNRPWIDPSKFEGDDKLCQIYEKKTEVGSTLGEKTQKVGLIKKPENVVKKQLGHENPTNVAVEEILNRPWIDPSKFEGDDKLCQMHKKKTEVGSSLGEKTQKLGLIKKPENVVKKQLGFKNQLGHENATTAIKNNNQRRPRDRPTATLQQTSATNQVANIEEAKKAKETAHMKKLHASDDNDEEENEVEVRSGFHLPPLLDDLDDSCFIHEDEKKIKASLVSRCPDHNEEVKIKGLKRKINKGYDEIASEKKKRLDPQVKKLKLPSDITEPSTRAKKAPVKKRVICRLRGLRVHRRMKLDPAMFV